MEFYFILHNTDRGNCKEPRNCARLVGNCADCGKHASWTEQIFCANYLENYDTQEICQKTYCTSCYSSPNKHYEFLVDLGEKFNIISPGSKEDLKIASAFRRKNKRLEYMTARSGDH